MAEIVDILLDNDNEFRSLNGDFFLGDSETQNIQFIIQAVKGNFLEYPTLGVEIDKYRAGSLSLDELTRSVRLELEKDQLSLESFTIDGDDLIIDAKRIN